MLTLQEIFKDTTLSWGQKHYNRKLIDVWKTDRGYLVWACNLDRSKPRAATDSLPPVAVCRLVKIALELERGDPKLANEAFERFSGWHELSQRGIGLEEIIKPSPAECRKALAQCTVLGGHSDLDGLYSMAIAIAHGKALGGPTRAQSGSIRVLNYYFSKLSQYTAALGLIPGDRLVVIDFAAHPDAMLTFDHHSTCLSFWEEGTPRPAGVYDTAIPSCPRLLAIYCEFEIDETILAGCDQVDGAMYPNLEAALSLSNPFSALEYCLGVDVSDVTRRDVVLTLAQNKLDPHSVLDQPSWKARLRLVKCEMDEQRKFWENPELVVHKTKHAVVIDSREAPHSASKFRYLPFELPAVEKRPYLITFRSTRFSDTINLGVGRNPFLSDRTIYEKNPLDVGALLKSLGQGGGRKEVGSLTIPRSELESVLEKIIAAVE